MGWGWGGVCHVGVGWVGHEGGGGGVGHVGVGWGGVKTQNSKNNNS